MESADAQEPVLLAQAGTGSQAASSATGASAGTASAAGAAFGIVIGFRGILAALAAVGGVPAIHNSNRYSSSPASRPTAASSSVDGYISGATVFIDVSGNGQLDTGEPSTTTDEQGIFSLPADVSGTLIEFGGTDVSTGLEFKGALKASAGATVITPLTTLVSDLVTAGASLAEAKTTGFTALGQSALSSSVDLLKWVAPLQPTCRLPSAPPRCA